MKKVLLIHGPNLNLLGEREPETYGNTSEKELLAELRRDFPGIEINFFQSNHEGELTETIQKAGKDVDGILINAGAYSHTSVAMADALNSIGTPAISVHISNIYRREAFRHKDMIASACKGSIVGLGIQGYSLAMECLLDLLKD